MKKAISRINAITPSSFVNALQEAYGMENHQLILLPLLKKAATSLTLQNMMARGLYSTRDHLSRLEEAFTLLGQRRRSHLPETILTLGREAEDLIAGTIIGTATRDTGLIIIAQKIEQYEMAVYAELADMARDLEMDEVLDLIEATLYEEKESDELLTALAENYINIEASRE